jgi:dihydroorotase/N-acyl-D-amino-acid deacylase
MDVYPYTASATSLEGTLIPSWARDGGREALVKRIADRETRARIHADVAARMRRRGFEDEAGIMRYSACDFDPALAGKTLEEGARIAGREATVEGTADSVLDFIVRGRCRTIQFGIDEADMNRVLVHPASMIASDGEVPTPGKGVPHPRSYGTFARVLALYVRERGLLRLEDAIRKMTSFPAQRIGLSDRGVLRPGMKADLAVFDPAIVRDTATYDDPHRYAEGFSHVIVNGAVVFEGGAMTAARPGRVLYGPAKRPEK